MVKSQRQRQLVDREPLGLCSVVLIKQAHTGRSRASQKKHLLTPPHRCLDTEVGARNDGSVGRGDGPTPRVPAWVPKRANLKPQGQIKVKQLPQINSLFGPERGGRKRARRTFPLEALSQRPHPGSRSHSQSRRATPTIPTDDPSVGLQDSPLEAMRTHACLEGVEFPLHEKQLRFWFRPCNDHCVDGESWARILIRVHHSIEAVDR